MEGRGLSEPIHELHLKWYGNGMWKAHLHLIFSYSEKISFRVACIHTEVNQQDTSPMVWKTTFHLFRGVGAVLQIDTLRKWHVVGKISRKWHDTPHIPGALAGKLEGLLSYIHVTPHYYRDITCTTIHVTTTPQHHNTTYTY